MYIALLITGIVITSIAIISITVFSIVNFVLKRINKEERKTMTDDEKRKEKLFSKSLKWLKRILKLINKRLLENLWAFYGIATVSVVGGVSMMVVGAVQKEAHKQEMVETASSVFISSSISEEFSLNEESSSLAISSISSSSNSTEASSSDQVSSQGSSSSETISSGLSSSSSIEISSSFDSSSSSSSSSSQSPSSEGSSSSTSTEPSAPFVLSYTVRYIMLCDYNESYSERSYPFELIVAESSFAEDYEEYTTSVITSERIKWYKDSSCTEEYDFDTPITEDVTLYGYYYDEP